MNLWLQEHLYSSKNCGCYQILLKKGKQGGGLIQTTSRLSNLFMKVEKISDRGLDKIKKNMKSRISKFGLDILEGCL